MGSIKSRERAIAIGQRTQFKKGTVPNPNGAPRKLPELDQLLITVLSESQNGVTAAQAILLKLRQRAINGDIRAAEMILDRAYGKSKQPVELFNKEDTVLRFGYGEEKPV